MRQLFSVTCSYSRDKLVVDIFKISSKCMLVKECYLLLFMFTNVDASKNADHFHCKIDDVLIFLPVQTSVKGCFLYALFKKKKTQLQSISFNLHVFFGRSNSSVKF